MLCKLIAVGTTVWELHRTSVRERGYFAIISHKPSPPTSKCEVCVCQRIIPLATPRQVWQGRGSHPASLYLWIWQLDTIWRNPMRRLPVMHLWVLHGPASLPRLQTRIILNRKPVPKTSHLPPTQVSHRIVCSQAVEQVRLPV